MISQYSHCKVAKRGISTVQPRKKEVVLRELKSFRLMLEVSRIDKIRNVYIRAQVECLGSQRFERQG